MTDDSRGATTRDASFGARTEMLGGPATAHERGVTRARPARRHPARVARLGAAGLSLAATAGLTGFFLLSAGSDGGPSVALQVAPAAVRSLADPTTAASTRLLTRSIAPTTTALRSTRSTQVTTAPKSKVVDGGVFQNKWGEVQVQATFGSGGAIVAVDAIRSPNGQGKSIRINDRAVPALNGEALSAQSAVVDTVSGATYTSVDYRRSLQSAIDAARSAALTTLT